MLIDLSTPGGATLALLPELLLTAWALVVLLVVAWRHKTAHDMRLVGTLSLVGYALAGLGTAKGTYGVPPTTCVILKHDK